MKSDSEPAGEAGQKKRAVDQHSRQTDWFASSYSRLESNPYTNCFTYSRRRLDEWLNRYLPQDGTGMRLLDVGCGTGHHLAQLRSRGFEVVGVDGSAEMLEQARTNNPGAEFYQSDVESLPLSDSSFDYVVCIEVLRYLPNSARCIGEMARVLKPGGTCLATAVPRFNLNGYWLINRLAALVPLGRLVRLKQFFTTPRGLARAFDQNGFGHVKVHGVYLGPINWVERLAPRLLSPLLRTWEPFDRIIANLPLLRNFSNLLLVRGVRSNPDTGP